MTPAGIEPATFRFVAQPLNHYATAVPHYVHLVGGGEEVIDWKNGVESLKKKNYPYSAYWDVGIEFTNAVYVILILYCVSVKIQNYDSLTSCLSPRVLVLNIVLSLICTKFHDNFFLARSSSHEACHTSRHISRI